MKKLIFATIIVLTYSCQSEDDSKDKNLLFDPVNHMTMDDVLLYGYEKSIGVDIPMFEKTNIDTTIAVTFDSEHNAIRSKTWRVNYRGKNQDQINEFLFVNGFVLFQDFCYDRNDFCRLRYLYNSRFNEVYRVTADTTTNTVDVTCFYPLTESKNAGDFFVVPDESL